MGWGGRKINQKGRAREGAVVPIKGHRGWGCEEADLDTSNISLPCMKARLKKKLWMWAPAELYESMPSISNSSPCSNSWGLLRRKCLPQFSWLVFMCSNCHSSLMSKHHLQSLLIFHHKCFYQASLPVDLLVASARWIQATDTEVVSMRRFQINMSADTDTNMLLPLAQ